MHVSLLLIILCVFVNVNCMKHPSFAWAVTVHFPVLTETIRPYVNLSILTQPISDKLHQPILTQTILSHTYTFSHKQFWYAL